MKVLDRTGSSLPPRSEQHALLTSFLLVLASIVVTVGTVQVRFESNDDVAFMLMLSGQALSPKPTGEIFWIHFLLSHTLAWLYRLQGNVPWYGLMHLGSLVLSLWAILYAVLLKNYSWQRASLCLLCLVSLGLPFVLALQFTKTAFLVGLGGVLLLATTLQQYFSRSTGGGQILRRLAGATCLLMLALMIRRESLQLIGVLSIPLFGVLAWSAWHAQRLFFFLTVLTSFSLALITLELAHDWLYAQDPAWERFQRLNSLKSEFLDYHRISYTAGSQSYFQEIGWSENDYRCLQNWWYLDPHIYSPEKMQAITTHFSPTSRSAAAIATALRSLANNCFAGGMAWIAIPLCTALALLEVRRFPALLTLLITFGGSGLILTLLAVFFKLPPYICQPILTAPCWIALWLGNDCEDLAPPAPRLFFRQLSGMLLIGMVVVVLLFRANSPLAKLVTSSDIVVQNNIAFRQSLLYLHPTSSQTFVLWGAIFPYTAILPLEHHNYLHNFKAIAIAAGNQSPLQQRMLEAQGIADLHRALFEREDVFLSFRSEDAQGTLLTRYLAEHYEVSVTLTPIFDSPSLRFWKVMRIPSPASTS